MSGESKEQTATILPITVGGMDREVKLHPLVLINISDHYTREKIRSPDSKLYTASERVAGVLFGVQTGKVVDVLESYDMKYEILDTGVLRFDEDLLLSKRKQFVEIFPNYEILGWYTTGATVLTSHLETHALMTNLNPNPIMLTLDPKSEDEETLPIKVLETQVTSSGDSVFVELDFKIDTLEPERVCVDHISNQKPQTDASAVAEHNKSLKNALVAMKERITSIQQFLSEVRSGRREAKPALMRRIAALCNLLPAGSSNDFQAALLNEENDTSLITYIAELTKIAVAIKSTKTKVIKTFSDGSNRSSMLGGHMPMDAFNEGGYEFGGMGGSGMGGGRRQQKNSRGQRSRN